MHMKRKKKKKNEKEKEEEWAHHVQGYMSALNIITLLFDILLTKNKLFDRSLFLANHKPVTLFCSGFCLYDLHNE